MAAAPLMTLAAIKRLTDIDLKALEDQKWLLCNYDNSEIKRMPAEAPLVRCSFSDAKVREGM